MCPAAVPKLIIQPDGLLDKISSVIIRKGPVKEQTEPTRQERLFKASATHTHTHTHR